MGRPAWMPGEPRWAMDGPWRRAHGAEPERGNLSAAKAVRWGEDFLVPFWSFKKGLAVRAKPIFQLDAHAGYVRGGPVNVQRTFTVATRLYRRTVSPASRASPLPQHPLTWLPAQIIAPTLSGSGSVCVTGADTTRRIASCALNASTARSCAWLAMGSSR